MFDKASPNYANRVARLRLTGFMLLAMTEAETPKTAVLQALGLRLRRLRKAYGASIHQPGFSMAEMARVLGVVEERYRTWERGLREPPLWILLKLKHLTGYSIDTLLTGVVSPPDTGIYPEDAEDYERGQQMAGRICWVRQAFEPDIEKAAEMMGVRLDVWTRWELGLERPPLLKLAEFAGRFSVSLDFLYSGRPVGVDRALLELLIEQHPELTRPRTNPDPLASDRRTATRDAADPGSNGRQSAPPQV